MRKSNLKARLFQTTGRLLKTTVVPPPIPSSGLLASPFPAFREGELFDNTYRLVRLLGEGSMGAVYEATHARLAGRYAIKVLLVKPTVASEAIVLFAREARINSLLQHPNIVQVIDHNTTRDGTEYLVMEYLAGESLAQRLQRKAPLPLETVVGIVDQIAAGLAAAHAYGVVHCDLKPDNIFLVPVEGRDVEVVKILDFGISKVKGPSWGRQAPEGTVVGTPLYMAPEQVEGRVADADAATDQFALAVIAYEMLTGRNPFQGETVEAVFSLVLTSQPPPMEIGRDVELVIRRGLAKSNNQRFASITGFSDALRAAAAGRLRDTQWAATLAYTAGEMANRDSKGKIGRRWRGLVLATGVLASISIAFVVGGRVNRRPSLANARSSPAPTTEVAAQAGVRVAEQAAEATKPETRTEGQELDAATPAVETEVQAKAPGETSGSAEPPSPTLRPEPARRVHHKSSSSTTTSRSSVHHARSSQDEDNTLSPSDSSN